MIDSDYAGRQLRVIRALMERATIYRAISAPTALVGGLLSFGGYAVSASWESAGHALTPEAFVTLWLAVLVLTGVANVWSLRRGAARRGEPFFSAGMKCALLSLAPAFIFAGVLTLLAPFSLDLVALSWITLYGIGLLATQHFAPRSLVLLGLAFFVAGSGLFLLLFLLRGPQWDPSALMAATFGGFHLLYAIAVWLRREDRSESDPTLNETGHV